MDLWVREAPQIWLRHGSNFSLRGEGETVGRRQSSGLMSSEDRETAQPARSNRRNDPARQNPMVIP